MYNIEPIEEYHFLMWLATLKHVAKLLSGCYRKPPWIGPRILYCCRPLHSPLCTLQSESLAVSLPYQLQLTIYR